VSEPTRPKRILLRLRFLAVAGLLTFLTGCGTYADFGRVRPSLVNDDIHEWLGPAAVRNPIDPPWRHQLTDEERRLRDLAYPLIEPPYDRQTWYSVLGEFGAGHHEWPYPDRGAYTSRLFATSYRSQTARYNRLIEDIRNDVIRLDPFFANARYVLDMDQKREQSMGYIAGLTKEERVNTLNRIAENRAIVAWVRGSLRERAESYKVALERMVIAAPSPVAVEAERSLTLLNQHLSGYNV
jgi:hypothetical protein